MHPKIILSIKDKASSNFSSGINFSEDKEVLVGVSQLSSISSSISIAYLYIEFINPLNFSLSSVITLGCASIIETTISKATSLKFWSSSKFLFSIILLINIVISLKFFFNIAGWNWAKFDKAKRLIFKLSISFSSKHLKTVFNI